jgi:pimeloyl-ACP methyl ester carboxylesterase
MIPLKQMHCWHMSRLAELLAPRFTVYTYDRRGRGESSNSRPYALEREAEDIDALIQAAGGTAFVYGISSGGCLALEAALKLGSKVKKLAIYEAPYNSSEAARQEWKEYRKQLAEALAAGRRGDAVAPTLAYDAAAMGEDRAVPVKRAANVTVPALVMDGGANGESLWRNQLHTMMLKNPNR